jgi:hypothetical protein
VDVVEVLRGTTAGPLLVAAGAAGGLAAVATVVAIVAWWHGGSRRRGAGIAAVGPDRGGAGIAAVGPDRRGAGIAAVGPDRGVVAMDGVTLSLAVALATSAVEAGLLVADGAGADDRWLVAVAVRLALLATLLALHRDSDRHRRPALPTSVRAGLALLVLVTAAIGAPATVLSGRLWWAAATVVVLLGLVGLGWRVLVTSDRVAPTSTVLVLLVLLGIPLAIWSAPDPVPPHHQQRVVLDGVVLDLTFAPVHAGTNEAHLYAFDSRGRPAPVTDVHLAVVGVPGSGHRMFEVSPDHHLTYTLELPADPPWTVSLTLRGADERHRQLTLELDRP